MWWRHAPLVDAAVGGSAVRVRAAVRCVRAAVRCSGAVSLRRRRMCVASVGRAHLRSERCSWFASAGPSSSHMIGAELLTR